MSGPRAGVVIGVACVALLSVAAPRGSAQTVQGMVTKADTTVRLAGVQILFRSAKGQTVAQGRSGASGEFQIRLPAAGTYLLEAHAVGYGPRSLIVQPGAGEVLTVRLQLDPLPVQLAPVIVYGLTPREREFESRRHLKYNFSYDWTQFGKLRAQTIEDVMRFGLPGGGFPFCDRPQVYLDGKPSRTFGEQGLDVPLDWVYGIEMYRSFYDIPLQYRDLMGDRRCGAILIWTHPVGWKPPPDSGRGR